MPKEDIDKLEEFVSKVREDIDFVVFKVVEINPKLESLQPLIKKAWEDDRIFESLGFIPGTDAAKEMKGVLEEVL